MSSFDKSLPVRPDEWGFYDPDKAGLAAVLERLAARRRPRRQEAARTMPSPRDVQSRFTSNSR